MGKKRKNKKKKKLYSKKEFINIFCSECALCLGGPTICYNEIYKTSPSTFIKDIHKAIIEIKEWKYKRGEGLVFDPAQFRYAVCRNLADYCGSAEYGINCEYLAGCYKEFVDQIKGDGGNKDLKHRYSNKRQLKRNNKKAKKKKDKFVVKAYPTAFMNDNENWRKVIKRILSDGDNNRKQNKIEADSV